MDDSTLKTNHEELKTVIDLILNTNNSKLPNTLKNKNTVIKYTKLPDFDSKASWSQHNYTLDPRLRRIITLEDQPFKTTRSLKQDFVNSTNMMSNNYPKRKIKIITISDDDEVNPSAKLSKGQKKSATTRTSCRASGTNYAAERSQCSQKAISRVTRSGKYSGDMKQHLAKEFSDLNSVIKQNKKQLDNKFIKIPEYDTTTTFNGKELPHNPKKTNKYSKVSLSKNLIVSIENGSEKDANKQRLYDDLKSNFSSNKPTSRLPLKKSQYQQSKLQLVNDVQQKNKSILIHVPYDKKQKQTEKEQGERKNKVFKVDRAVGDNHTVSSKNIYVETDPLPDHIDQITEIGTDLNKLYKRVDDNSVQTDAINGKFDSLDIPNVTLTKVRNNLTEKEIVNYYSTSLPNLTTPSIDVISIEGGGNESPFHKTSSYIIGCATVTYTTKQKIDFQVVGKNKDNTNLHPSLTYPLSVVSLFKKDNRKSDNKLGKSKKKEKSLLNSQHINDLNPINCSRVSDGNRLVKPSDIIRTISVNNSLLQSDYICEQFQRELNFIDSFFESLQYLERLSEKCFTDVNIDSWIHNQQFEVNNSEYISNFTKNENGPNVDDTETMASNSLCQLNLLIHNEQRRARDFLFVLKMQEDVLKDYIKSQMLWLEKKKKQDNIDISALKKKQRGALLKLQHECGEMQRMRKALLSLSEKRKVALMKTKKKIEMKLKNNVDVEQILFGKKKLKNIPSDRCLAPLKCFDLSSSGCEESTTSRAKSETAWYSTLTNDTLGNSVVKSVTSAEKSIQTGDSIIATNLHEETTATAAENCIVVDGGYLNILFHNLSLPQIFSNANQYEVNEEALKNIVTSSNSHNISKNTDAIENLIDQVKNHDMDGSSSASTAHSLVEELDQYYKCFAEDEQSLRNSPECDDQDCVLVDCVAQSNSEPNSEVCDHSGVTMIMMDSDESLLNRLSDVCKVDSSCDYEPSVSVEIQTSNEETTELSVAGPLPVPAGAAASVDIQSTDTALWMPSKTSNDLESGASDQVLCSNLSSTSEYASPVLYEAEELRRQQLAIEREIKALEQQQSQLLVVREIPDKPPPPYTPPSEVRTPKPPRMFLSNCVTDGKIQKHFIDMSSDIFDIGDPYDAFVKDFCEENIQRQLSESTDKPWDACNLLPQKPQTDTKKIVDKTCTELKEVLSGVTPTCITGVGSRRTDHIDDILFAEWRRCEPEWTSLHTDEAAVKNQLFDSIYQKIIAETVEEYKKSCVYSGNK